MLTKSALYQIEKEAQTFCEQTRIDTGKGQKQSRINQTGQTYYPFLKMDSSVLRMLGAHLHSRR